MGVELGFSMGTSLGIVDEETEGLMVETVVGVENAVPEVTKSNRTSDLGLAR